MSHQSLFKRHQPSQDSFDPQGQTQHPVLAIHFSNPRVQHWAEVALSRDFSISFLVPFLTIVGGLLLALLTNWINQS